VDQRAQGKQRTPSKQRRNVIYSVSQLTVFSLPAKCGSLRKQQGCGADAINHVFTVEPMIGMGTWKDVSWPDDWTIVTLNGKRSAQFEHMVFGAAKTKSGLPIEAPPVAFTSTVNPRTSAYDYDALSLLTPFDIDVALQFTFNSWDMMSYYPSPEQE
jgi:hypothetical protein